MTNAELIEKLQRFGPLAEVQIFGSEQEVGVNSYWDVGKVNGISGSPDIIIEIGDVRCVG